MNTTNDGISSVRVISQGVKNFLYGLMMLVELVEEDAVIQMSAFVLTVLICVVATCAICCICLRSEKPEMGPSPSPLHDSGNPRRRLVTIRVH